MIKNKKSISDIKEEIYNRCQLILLENWRVIVITSLCGALLIAMYSYSKGEKTYKTSMIVELASTKILAENTVISSPIEEQSNVIYLLRKMPLNSDELSGCFVTNNKNNMLTLEKNEFIKILKGPANIIQIEVNVVEYDLSKKCGINVYKIIEKLQQSQINERKKDLKNSIEILNKLLIEKNNKSTQINSSLIKDDESLHALKKRWDELSFNMLSVDEARLNLITPIITDSRPIQKNLLIQALLGLLYGFLLSFNYFFIVRSLKKIQ